MSWIEWFVTPYDFYPSVLLGSLLAATWYAVGFVRSARSGSALRISRALAYFVGVLLIYRVLQTRIDYWSQHMFYVHRLHQFVLHYLAPFLIMATAPGKVLAAAWPKRFNTHMDRWTAAPALQMLLRFVLDPVIAVSCFAGLVVLWAIPPVHFYTMLSARLYGLMNWSMAISGLVFWGLILDPRSPNRSGALGYGARIAALTAAVAAQGAVSAAIGLSATSLYPVYAVCGRLWPLSPMTDQRLGGMVGLLAAITCITGLVTVFYRMLAEQSQTGAPTDGGKIRESGHEVREPVWRWPSSGKPGSIAAMSVEGGPDAIPSLHKSARRETE